MKIGGYLIPATLALFVAAGTFSLNKSAHAAECAAQIEATTKQYAASQEKYRYSEKLAGKIDKFLKKAQLRLDQGKKKGCFKLVKKARAKIAYRENKAKASGKGDGKNTASLSGRGKGGAKAKCAAEVKAADERLMVFKDQYMMPDKAEQFIQHYINRAASYLKEGKYKKCRKEIKQANSKMNFFQGR